jgi:hypothetical protein
LAKRWLRAQAWRQQRHQRWLQTEAKRQHRVQLLLDNLLKLVTPGDTHELRVPKYHIKAYHYDRLPELAAKAAELDGQANIYITLNPVWPNLVTNATNKSIVVRRYLFVDVDPTRLGCDPEGEPLTGDWCSTDAEKATAYTMAMEIWRYLQGAGWPDPALIDSGNGWALLYKIDVPAQDNDLIRRCILALKAKCEGCGLAATIDVLVANAGRFIKLPGTMNCKLVLPDRPRRRSALVSIPEPWELVPVELLEALAALTPIPITATMQSSSESDSLAEVIQGETGTAQLGDQAIIRRASTAINRKKFNKLWAGDFSGYRSHSDADAALLLMLAFWTNRDPVAMDRLFRESGLYRDKWEREDYRTISIQSAINCCAATYQPARRSDADKIEL